MLEIHTSFEKTDEWKCERFLVSFCHCCASRWHQSSRQKKTFIPAEEEHAKERVSVNLKQWETFKHVCFMHWEGFIRSVWREDETMFSSQSERKYLKSYYWEKGVFISQLSTLTNPVQRKRHQFYCFHQPSLMRHFKTSTKHVDGITAHDTKVEHRLQTGFWLNHHLLFKSGREGAGQSLSSWLRVFALKLYLRPRGRSAPLLGR